MTEDKLTELTYFVENYVTIYDRKTNKFEHIVLRDYQKQFLKTLK